MDLVKDIRFGKKKYNSYVVNKDLYKNWIKEYPEHSHINYGMFSLYCDKLLKEFAKQVLNPLNNVTLPFYCGELSIKFVNPKNKNKLHIYRTDKIEVPYLNFSTNGKIGKVIFSPRSHSRYNGRLAMVGFEPYTNLRLRASKVMKEIPEAIKTITHGN